MMEGGERIHNDDWMEREDCFWILLLRYGRGVSEFMPQSSSASAPHLSASNSVYIPKERIVLTLLPLLAD